MRKYLYHCVSEETAYIAEDYPWGFRLRTQAKFWIESSSRSDGGQRVVQKTLNPKTGRWCAPKKSIYYPVRILCLDENGHVGSCGIDRSCKSEYIKEFIEKHKDNLSDFQKNSIKEILAFQKVMENVKFTVQPSKYGPVNLFSKDPEEIKKMELIAKEQQENKKRNDEELKKINRAIGAEYNSIKI